MMQGLGQLPFDPPNVKGWPGGEAWITTYTLLLRQQFLRRMVEATTVSPMDAGNMAMSPRPNRRADRREQMPPGDESGADDGARGRSRVAACATPACEARLGPTLAGIDAAELSAYVAAAHADRRRRQRRRPAPSSLRRCSIPPTS